MSGTVTALALTPVKGTRLQSVRRIQLERSGVPANRRFYVIDDRSRMVNGKMLGGLQLIVADYSDEECTLALRFPDGQVVEGEVQSGASVTTKFFSHSAEGRLVIGPWSAALSRHFGRPLQLVEAPTGAVDRGRLGTVSLISRASIDRLAQVGGQSDVDARRFRMLIEVDGIAAHEEDQWVGRTVRIGAATVMFRGHVGRCLITSRDPDTGQIDLPTLDILGSYRGDLATTEPLPFGIHGEVLEAGAVAVGDRVQAASG